MCRLAPVCTISRELHASIPPAESHESSAGPRRFVGRVAETSQAERRERAPRDQAPHSEVAFRRRPAPPADRDDPTGSRAQAHGRRRAGGFRQDDTVVRMAREYGRRRERGRLGVARPERERARALLGLRHQGTAEHSARRWDAGDGAAAIGPGPRDRDGADDVDQRDRCHRRRLHGRSRRLPRDRCRAHPQRAGVSARSPAAAHAPRHRQSRGPTAAALPAPRPRRADRAAAGGPSLHARRSVGVPQPDDGARPLA